MSVFVINPLSDARWNDLVAAHVNASVFHQPAWLEALARTYDYVPIVLTSAGAGMPLSNGVVLCHVSSWLTGRRMVSLPFSDHCEPLLDNESTASEFINWLRIECDRRKWRYVELRPLSWNGAPERHMLRVNSYFFHRLDLASSLDDIFGRFHKDSVQRRIQRAERAGLTYEVGCSKKFLDEFYRLLVKTRKRQHLIPQPRIWFNNLMECMGDKMQIWVAKKGNVALAALLTLRHRSSVVYKYGCSDERFHALAAMPFLFWHLIEESKAEGAEHIDFGRSDLNNKGLVTFKDRFGTSKKQIQYYRYSPTKKGQSVTLWSSPSVRRILSILPQAMLPSAGRIIYRHIA